MNRKLEELFDLPPNEGTGELPLTTEETKTFIAEIDERKLGICGLIQLN